MFMLWRNLLPQFPLGPFPKRKIVIAFAYHYYLFKNRKKLLAVVEKFCQIQVNWNEWGKQKTCNWFTEKLFPYHPFAWFIHKTLTKICIWHYDQNDDIKLTSTKDSANMINKVDNKETKMGTLWIFPCFLSPPQKCW